MSHQRVFVDIETTGMRPTEDRMIEFALLRTEDDRIVERYETLLNPGRELPRMITQITGISYQHLKEAPRFEDVAEEIWALLEDAEFVAHNVQFDYRFVFQAFKRLGKVYNPPRLCTVRLSRQLYPGLKGHSLQKIIDRFGIETEERHRAMADVQATWAFFRRCAKSFPTDQFEQALQAIGSQPNLPPRIKGAELEQLPAGPGVYFFLDENGAPLYIGKSVHLRQRIKEHLRSARDTTKGAKIIDRTHGLKTIPTAGELGALIRESHAVKQHLPLVNRQLRRKRELVVVTEVEREGYPSVEIERRTTIDPAQTDQILGVYRSLKQAKETLRELSRDCFLCDKLLGLETREGACFGHALGHCLGACCGEESVELYSKRFQAAFEQARLARWPYPGPVLVVEHDAATDRTERHLIDQWCYLGSDQPDHPLTPDANRHFDLDTYRILHRFLTNPANSAKIIAVTSSHKEFTHANRMHDHNRGATQGCVGDF